jgi:hypothetical protein
MVKETREIQGTSIIGAIMALARYLLFQRQATTTYTVSNHIFLSDFLDSDDSDCVAMIAHIRSNFKPMHDLFLVMKSRETPTADEILMASGKKRFDDSIQAEYLKIIAAQASGIKEAFAKQQAKELVRTNILYSTFFLSCLEDL